MKSITYQSNSSININTALNSKDFLGYKSTVDDTTIQDRYLACKTTNKQTFSRSGWLERYLSLFCRTWLILLMMSAMCSTLAQPHMLENHNRRQNDFFQFSSNSEHHHFNHTYHHLSIPQIQNHHNQSITFHHHRSKLQIPRYSKSNNTNYNQPITSKPYQGPKRPSSKSFYNSQGDNRPDKRHIFSPRDSILSVKLTDRKSKNPRRFSNYREERDRSLYEYNDDDEVEEAGRPCVYSGHLKTESNWYGYLANISLAGGTGRLVFEFSYPAESCCLSVLFYYEDQLSIMSARTNCWQKEDLLRPDADQILRLTPSFSWSGCQIKKRQGGDMMVCKGGRSFTKHGYDFHSTSSKDKTDVDDKAGQRQRNSDVASNAAVWYVAVSRCASLRGLNLRYKLKVYGHSAPCTADYGNEDDISSDKESHWASKNHKQHKNPNDSNKKDSDVIKTGLASSSSSSSSQSSSSSSSSSSYQSHRPSDAAHTHLASDEWPVCTIEGSVNTTHSWFGFIKNLSLVDGGGFRFYFSLPYSMSPMNVLLYHDEDIRKLHWEQICWLKESVIESKHVLERIIDLTSRSIYNGCASKTGANIEGNNLTCRGEKIFSGDRNIFMALSNCRSREGLLLKYKLEVFGYKDQTMCSKEAGSYRKSLFLSIFVCCSLSLIMAAFR